MPSQVRARVSCLMSVAVCVCVCAGIVGEGGHLWTTTALFIVVSVSGSAVQEMLRVLQLLEGAGGKNSRENEDVCVCVCVCVRMRRSPLYSSTSQSASSHQHQLEKTKMGLCQKRLRPACFVCISSLTQTKTSHSVCYLGLNRREMVQTCHLI